jgi:hypothetical protein
MGNCRISRERYIYTAFYVTKALLSLSKMAHGVDLGAKEKGFHLCRGRTAAQLSNFNHDPLLKITRSHLRCWARQ